MIIDEQFLGTWFVVFGDGGGDWACSLRRSSGGGHHELTYRFRYYTDNKAHFSEDRKTWFSARANFKSDADAVRACTELAENFAEACGGTLHAMPLRAGESLTEFMERLKAQPWAHAMTAQ